MKVAEEQMLKDLITTKKVCNYVLWQMSVILAVAIIL